MRCGERRTHLDNFTVTPRNDLKVNMTDTKTLLQASSNIDTVSCPETDTPREHLRNGYRTHRKVGRPHPLRSRDGTFGLEPSHDGYVVCGTQ